MIVKTKRGQRIVKKLTKEAAAAALAAGAVVGGVLPVLALTPANPAEAVCFYEPLEGGIHSLK